MLFRALFHDPMGTRRQNQTKPNHLVSMHEFMMHMYMDKVTNTYIQRAWECGLFISLFILVSMIDY